MSKSLEESRALWNRSHLDLRSDEVLAQILDRGELNAWRALYALAKQDVGLWQRIVSVVRRVPIALPHFWLAAMAALGENIDFDARVPDYVNPSWG